MEHVARMDACVKLAIKAGMKKQRDRWSSGLSPEQERKADQWLLGVRASFNAWLKADNLNPARYDAVSFATIAVVATNYQPSFLFLRAGVRIPS